MNPPTTRDFWAFCRERDLIRIRRAAGAPPPWTEDTVLRDYRFCNIRREDDRGTRWYMEHIGKRASGAELLFQTVLYRLVNNTAWLERVGPLAGNFTLRAWRRNRWDIVKRMFAAGPLSSHAYLTFGGVAHGGSHLEGLAAALDWMAPHNNAQLWNEISESPTLEMVWRVLQQIPHVGPFVAGQIYRDLFLAGALPALDEDSFVYIGPGARAGLVLLYGDQADLDQMIHVPFSEKQRLGQLRNLWRRQPHWLAPKLLLADVQSCCCEWRKYWNIKMWLARERRRPRLRKYEAPNV